MKITKNSVRFFEAQQKDFGTEVALKNLMWELAAILLRDIGVTRIRTSYGKKNKGQY